MWQPVLMICGYFISVLGIAMLLPAALDIYYSGLNWSIFINASIVSVFIGLSLFLANRGKIKDISIQQAYLLTVISWVSVTLLAALPFIFYGTHWTDAVFEAASGISTTGATIYGNVEALPHSVLLWRALLNGMGGVGIVIFAIAMLPFLGIGGMQIFQRENSDVNEKFMPKISYIAKRIIAVYSFLLIACLLSLKMAGMGWFDALCHALSTISTGGFSTKNTSVGYFNDASVDWIITLFMFLGAVPLTLYHSLLATKDIHSLRSTQVAAFIKVLLIYVGFMSIWLMYNHVYEPFNALRYAAFNVVSIVTSTGFSSANWLNWGAFTATAFVVFALTGGCTGSTSGGVKIFRWQIVIAQLKRAFVTTTEPNRLMPLKVGGTTVSYNVANSIFVFFIAYAFSVAGISLAVALSGVDFATAFGATIACITNSGPGISQNIGPAGNFGGLGDSVKLILAFTMILGRLEVLTILVLFSKNFWR